MTIRLSILDQSPIGEGSVAADALAASVDLAHAAEELGYTRLWAAEHHASPGFASTAPEILATAILSRTRHMRVGTGGILLPHYPAGKVAEVFSTLAALYPGRVDLGVGRGGGPAPGYQQQIDDLRWLLGLGRGLNPGPDPGPGPSPGDQVDFWLLGTSAESARMRTWATTCRSRPRSRQPTTRGRPQNSAERRHARRRSSGARQTRSGGT